MMAFRPGDAISTAGAQGARLILLGGATLSGPRYVWWNFVSSSREKIDEAKEQWRRGAWGAGMFDLPPQDRDEFIPPQRLERRSAKLRTWWIEMMRRNKWTGRDSDPVALDRKTLDVATDDGTRDKQ